MITVLPQLPCENRYTADWIQMWDRELTKLNVQFEIFGHDIPTQVTKFFTNPEYALRYECDQIRALSQTENLDKVLCLDVDFPGLLCAAIPTLKLTKPNVKFYGYLHVGSWGSGDIFEGSVGKKQLERAIFDTFDMIFVATNYHKEKIQKYYGEKFDNLKVVGFPFYGKDVEAYVNPLSFEEKKGVVINGRWEQSDSVLLSRIQTHFLDLRLVPIRVSDRKGYFEQLNQAKIVISVKIEETFGVGQLEAGTLGSIPLCPKAYSYPEVIGDDRLLYSNTDDLIEKLSYLVNLGKNPFQIDIKKYEQVIPNIVFFIESAGVEG